MAGIPIVCTDSELYNSFISQSFHLEILNTDFLKRFGAKVFADSRGKSLQTLEVITKQNFVLKVYIVITSKVCADFRFESPVSIGFHSEILALLPPKSSK